MSEFVYLPLRRFAAQGVRDWLLGSSGTPLRKAPSGYLRSSIEKPFIFLIYFGIELNILGLDT